MVISLSALVLASLMSFGELSIKQIPPLQSSYHASDPPIARKEE